MGEYQSEITAIGSSGGLLFGILRWPDAIERVRAMDDLGNRLL